MWDGSRPLLLSLTSVYPTQRGWTGDYRSYEHIKAGLSKMQEKLEWVVGGGRVRK